ncbi:MAG TPA: penicillin-binding protein 1A [Stellaceae bacterium]|nr:penicillin-binding protein 1A [Stellaceae bacterium]
MRSILYFAGTLLLLSVVGLTGLWLVYEHFAADLPNYQQLADYQPATVTRVQAGDGRLLAEYATEKRVFVPISAVPPLIVKAVLAAEDREFYQHGGVDPAAIVRAALTNLVHIGQHRRGVGASTITQQVAKNFLLSNEYSLQRKIKEAILAVRLEETLSKDRILELYLNEIYFGRGAYGIASASLNYFNKSLEDVSIAEAAFLASLPKGPSNYDPVRFPEAAKSRRDYVIDGMVKIGAISAAEGQAAMAEPIQTRSRDETEVVTAPYFSEETRRELLAMYGEATVYKAGLSVRTSLDPRLQAIADQALRNGLVTYDRRHGYRGPIGHLDTDHSRTWQPLIARLALPAGAVTGTTKWQPAVALDVKPDGVEIGLPDGSTGFLPMSELAWARPVLDDQRYGRAPRVPSDVMKTGDVVLVERLAQTVPEAPAKPAAGKPQPASQPARVEASGRPIYGLRQIPDVSGALVAMDPHTGRVFAIDGGYSYEMSQFNRAIQAKRQPGSTIKPIVYLAALDNGMTPSTLILDGPIALEQGPGLPLWRPGNFESGEFLGPIPLRVAIEKSVNVATVRMAATIGIDKIAPYIERLGVMDRTPLEYSMVLGAGETTLLRMTTAYSMIVNGGKRVTPSLIDRVQDRNGKTIFRHDDRPCPQCGDEAWSPDDVPTLPDTREQVIDPRTAYQMVSILEGVVQRGTGHKIGDALKRPLAGKTGTTSNIFDTWFVGFSPDLAVGIYVAFDSPRTLGEREQAADITAPIFRDFMAAALKDAPAIPFRIPPGLLLTRVDPKTGKLAGPGAPGAIYEAFKPGTEPSGHDAVVDIDGDPGADGQTFPVNAPQPESGGPPESAQAPTRTAPASGTGGLY